MCFRNHCHLVAAHSKVKNHVRNTHTRKGKLMMLMSEVKFDPREQGCVRDKDTQGEGSGAV